TPSGTTPAAPVASHRPAGEQRPPTTVSRRSTKAGRQSASRGSPQKGLRVQVSMRSRRARERERWRQAAGSEKRRRAAEKEKWRQAALVARGARGFSP
ncbi:MAG TPA: hypothetical protein VE713_08135, partial [Pyrinomonadaceae bacterium]|nr:hypothetical protein [Pyrinomonadaceae bacterium]